jgi:energy-coupling factor transporter ATP-binding protein EcfA2
MKIDDDRILPLLRLPKRYEILEQKAAASGIDPREFVERVDSEAERIDQLIRNVHISGCGQIELFLGLSGSGKTTFVSTLPKFFDSVDIHSFKSNHKLSELPDFVINSAAAKNTNRIILIENRDNPKAEDLAAVEEVFDELRQAFRKPGGDALVLWPITNREAATKIANTAWNVGRDSVVDITSKGLHQFSGLEKDRFYEVADLTARNLTGDGLEAYGICLEEGIRLLPEADTITTFYSLVEKRAAKVRGDTLYVLRKRIRPQVWIVLPGDVPAAIEATVSSLTQGTRSRVDVDLLAEFIDNPNTDANYVADWKKRRAMLAHIMRALDVRIIGLPPNVALAAVRAFGGPTIKSALKQQSVNLGAAKTAMRRSRLYKAILVEIGQNPEPYGSEGKIGQETEYEYRRLQASASKADSGFNKALGMLISETLKEDGLNRMALTLGGFGTVSVA